MLRLADGETDRRLAGRRIANEFARAHEGRPPIRRANRRGAGFGAKEMEADLRVILYITNSGTARRITGAIA